MDSLYRTQKTGGSSTKRSFFFIGYQIFFFALNLHFYLLIKYSTTSLFLLINHNQGSIEGFLLLYKLIFGGEIETSFDHSSAAGRTNFLEFHPGIGEPFSPTNLKFSRKTQFFLLKEKWKVDEKFVRVLWRENFAGSIRSFWEIHLMSLVENFWRSSKINNLW